MRLISFCCNGTDLNQIFSPNQEAYYGMGRKKEVKEEKIYNIFRCGYLINSYLPPVIPPT